MTRNTKKPITDESFDKSGMFVLAPVGPTFTDRYPVSPRTLREDPITNGPVDFWLVRNKTLNDLRVAFDSDATATNGHVVHAGEDFEIPRRTQYYISVWGNGIQVEVHWFAW